MMDVGHRCYKDTRCGASGPTVELVVDYDSAKRTKAPESPQNLVKDICKLGVSYSMTSSYEASN